jgi:hypothetical protein
LKANHVGGRVPGFFEGQGNATLFWEIFTRKEAYYAVADAQRDG